MEESRFRSPRDLLDKLAPPLSIRRQFLSLYGEAWQVLRTRGPGAAAGHVLTAAHRYFETGALLSSAMAEAEYSYARWIAANEPGPEELAQQRQSWPALAAHPLFTLVVAACRPPFPLLAAAIDSVLQQSYPHWQLIVVSTIDTHGEAGTMLKRAADNDRRILLLELEHDLGVSRNTNAGLTQAAGDFLVFLDHDGVLAPDLLYRVAETIAGHPDADIVYFDEDKLAAADLTRTAAWFKPDWSPDAMLSVNLLGHGVYRRALVETVGGLDPATDGAQDWDLGLRCSKLARQIVHIPRVLYHGRQGYGGDTTVMGTESQASTAQLRAVESHLSALQLSAAQVDFVGDKLRVRFPTQDARVSIVVPTRDKVHLLRSCLRSLETLTAYNNYEVLLVDTGSVEDATWAFYEELRQHPRFRLLKWTRPFNFSAVCNWGAAQATGDVLLFLNNDIEIVEPDWLANMLGWALRPEVGAVGARLVRPDGSLQHAGIVLGLAGICNHVFDSLPASACTLFGATDWHRNYQAVTGACLMLRRELFLAVGGFDELYHVAYSDVELCLRVQSAGYRNVFTPFATLVHHESATRGRDLHYVDVLRISYHVLPRLAGGDPYFNANLSYCDCAPTLRGGPQDAVAASLAGYFRQFDIGPDLEQTESALPFPGDDFAAPHWAEALQQAGGIPRNVLVMAADTAQETSVATCRKIVAALQIQGARPKALFARATGDSLPQMDAEVCVDAELGPYGRNVFALPKHLAQEDAVIVLGAALWRTVLATCAYGKPAVWWLDDDFETRNRQDFEAILRQTLDAAAWVVFPSTRSRLTYAEVLDHTRFVVLDAEDNWSDLLASLGTLYRTPTELSL